MTELPNSKNKGNSYIFKNVATLYDLDRRIEYPLPIDKQDITVGRFDPENDQEKADVQIETDDIYMSHIQISLMGRKRKKNKGANIHLKMAIFYVCQ